MTRIKMISADGGTEIEVNDDAPPHTSVSQPWSTSEPPWHSLGGRRWISSATFTGSMSIAWGRAL